jgi:hypothetical protein
MTLSITVARSTLAATQARDVEAGRRLDSQHEDGYLEAETGEGLAEG